MKDPLAFKIYFLLQTGILKKTKKKILSQPHTSNAKLRVTAIIFTWASDSVSLGHQDCGVEHCSFLFQVIGTRGQLHQYHGICQLLHSTRFERLKLGLKTG